MHVHLSAEEVREYNRRDGDEGRVLVESENCHECARILIEVSQSDAEELARRDPEFRAQVEKARAGAMKIAEDFRRKALS